MDIQVRQSLDPLFRVLDFPSPPMENRVMDEFTTKVRNVDKDGKWFLGRFYCFSVSERLNV
jgi:hypothetical protein